MKLIEYLNLFSLLWPHFTWERDEAKDKVRELQTIIIEDDHKSYTLIQEALHQAEINCFFAHAWNAESALDIMETNKRQVCLIILDIMLPGMDGGEFLSTIADDNNYCPVPVVLVTSADEDQIHQTTGELNGIFATIRKPFSYLQLAKILQQINLAWPL